MSYDPSNDRRTIDDLRTEIERLRTILARVVFVAEDHRGTIAGEDLRDALNEEAGR